MFRHLRYRQPICRSNRAARVPFSARNQPAARVDSRGFTLLELLLALSLTVIVLMLVNMAVDLHMRQLDQRRMQLEESQLARSILRLIASDLRGAVQHFEQDTSAIEELLQQSVASAASSLGQAATSGSGIGGAAGATAGSSAAGSSAAGGSSSSANPGGSSSQSGQGSSNASGSGAGSSTSQQSSRSSTSSSSGGGSTSFSGDPTTSAGNADPMSTSTEDLSVTTIPPVPGLFGNQYQMQVDVSRLPRIEEYQRYLTPDAATSVVDIPSDVKTVTYYVQPPGAAPSGGASESLDDLSDPNAQGAGLVRRVLDRSVTLWAMNNGNYTSLQNSGEVIAPEVAGIEFQYFDGTEWLTEWDSELEKKLPVAVLIILALRPPGSDVAIENSLTTLSAEAAAQLHLYRMLVHLPAGGQSAPESSSSGSSSDGTTADMSTGGAL